jgi:hypothetical protein
MSRDPLAQSGAPADVSQPRAMVWTVDPDRPPGAFPAPPRHLYHLQNPPPPGTEQPPPAEQQQRTGRKAALVVGGMAAVVLVIGVGSVAAAMNGGGRGADPHITLRPQAAEDQPSASIDPPTSVPTGMPTQAPSDSPPRPEPTDPAQTPPPQVDPAAVDAQRPKGLALVTDSGSTVTLKWKAQRAGDLPLILRRSPGDRMTSVRSGSTTYTVGGLDPATGYCFEVGTVVSFGRPSSVAWSPSLCIRGATETAPDDEVQPPIVLPPASPTS